MSRKKVKREIEAVYPALGARVRMIRETLGLDQAELARRIGYERTSIVNFEAGRQRILVHHVYDLAQALGTTPKNLLRGIWL